MEFPNFGVVFSAANAPMKADLKVLVVPVVVTLAVTLLRLTGELLHWPEAFFNRSPGGAGALIGIAWLAPVFGAFFGWKLANAGESPRSHFRVLLFVFLGGVAFIAVNLTGLVISHGYRGVIIIIAIASAAAIVVAAPAWPMLYRLMFGYGLGARLPVVVVMFFAILGDWGTHYDAPPPNSPEIAAMSPMQEFVWTGFVPQLTFWMAYTILSGMFFGGIAAWIFRVWSTSSRVPIAATKSP